MTASETHRAIHAVWSIESARVIASLARIVRDVGLAEELAQDALVAALEQWPEQGIPNNPAAWLMATAKHRALNLLRRGKMLARKHVELGRYLRNALQPPYLRADSPAQFLEQLTFTRLDALGGSKDLLLVFLQCRRYVTLGTGESLSPLIIRWHQMGVAVGDLDEVTEDPVVAHLQRAYPGPGSLIKLDPRNGILPSVPQ